MALFWLILGITVGHFGTAIVRSVMAARTRRKQNRFQLDRVILEEVVLFKLKGCGTCGGTGEVKKHPAPGAARMRMPCSCASNRFLQRYGGETTMLGPYRVWKHGRRPPFNVLSLDARRPTSGAAA